MSYLTVQEFAKRAGVTQQAVYGRISTTLAPYVAVEHGKKRISEEALKLYENIKVERADTENQIENLNNYINELKGQHEADQRKIDELQALITFLHEQIRIKDKQIDSLHEMSKNLTELASQAQKLHALEKRTEESEQGTQEVQTNDNTVTDQSDVQAAAVQETPAQRKRRWYDAFLGKN